MVGVSNLNECSVYAFCGSIAFLFMFFSCVVCWSHMLLMTFVCFGLYFQWCQIRCFLKLNHIKQFKLLMDDPRYLILQLYSLDFLLSFTLQLVFLVTYVFSF